MISKEEREEIRKRCECYKIIEGEFGDEETAVFWLNYEQRKFLSEIPFELAQNTKIIPRLLDALNAAEAENVRLRELVEAKNNLTTELEWQYEILLVLEWTWIRFEYCKCEKHKNNLDNAYSEIWATMFNADRGEVVTARDRVAELEAKGATI